MLQLILWLTTVPAAHAQWVNNPFPFPTIGNDSILRLDLDAGPGIVIRRNHQEFWLQTVDGGRTWTPWPAGQSIPANGYISPVPAPNGIPSRKGDILVVTYTQNDIFSGDICKVGRSADFGQTVTALTTFNRWCWIIADPSSTQVFYGLSFDLNGLTFPNMPQRSPELTHLSLK